MTTQLRMSRKRYSTNMAASFMTAGRTFLKGFHLVPGRRLLSQSSHTPAVCHCLQLEVARCRPLHVSAAAPLVSSRTGPQRTVHTEQRRAEEEAEGPEYIPKRKAKNPMKIIGYAWMIGLPTGIISFLLAKREVDKNRLKQLKIRQRMKRSNEGPFEGSRYRQNHTEDVKLDQ
ncbi:DUF4748 domain-containing protein [Anabas testudineus]|nr:DUF4748 domain-containing protein [Anabas testudineus]